MEVTSGLGCYFSRLFYCPELFDLLLAGRSYYKWPPLPLCRRVMIRHHANPYPSSTDIETVPTEWASPDGAY